MNDLQRLHELALMLKYLNQGGTITKCKDQQPTIREGK